MEYWCKRIVQPQQNREDERWRAAIHWFWGVPHQIANPLRGAPCKFFLWLCNEWTFPKPKRGGQLCYPSGKRYCPWWCEVPRPQQRRGYQCRRPYLYRQSVPWMDVLYEQQLQLQEYWFTNIFTRCSRQRYLQCQPYMARGNVGATKPNCQSKRPLDWRGH